MKKVGIVFGIVIVVGIAIWGIVYSIKSPERVIAHQMTPQEHVEKEKEVYDPEKEKEDRANWDKDKLSMSVKEGTVTKNGAVFLITDENEVPWIYGMSVRFSIEKKENNQWTQLNYLSDSEGWEEKLLFPLKGKKTYEWEINWKNYYGTLKRGEYRIKKDISNYEHGEKYLYAEFEIK